MKFSKLALFDFLLRNASSTVLFVNSSDDGPAGESAAERATRSSSSQDDSDWKETSSREEEDVEEMECDESIAAEVETLSGEDMDEDETTNEPMSKKAKKSRAGPGMKKGTKLNCRHRSFWYSVCEKFKAGKHKSQAAFLRSDDSGDLHYQRDQKSFSRAWNQYIKGELKDVELKRAVNSRTEAVKLKLIEYVELRAKLYVRDKCGLNWIVLKEKALQYAEEEGIGRFNASAGWLDSTLKKHKKIGVSLHGEGMELTPEEQAKALAQLLHRVLSESLKCSYWGKS